ncbi:MAG: zinc ribbon domain-containing protein [Lachnospiraceae bacterium]|jgi:hypothetical protein|nr:zinc ribbon domain-containing protein [Lachnospiraceae bacterium]
MRKCRNCKVEILDATAVCPLCNSVLEVSGEGEGGTGYPDVKAAVRKLSFIVRLYSFLAIVSEAALVTINYLYFHGIWWSAITGICILYFYVTLKYSLQKNKGYQAVLLVQVIGAVLLVIAADNIAGYRGWSVNYVLPGAILLLNGTIATLMVINASNWQSYILMQIFTAFASASCVALWRFGIITKPLLSLASLAVSLCLLLGTLIFGDRKAKAELKRRFHV